MVHVVVGGGAHGSVAAAYLNRGAERAVIMEAGAPRREQLRRDGVRLAGFRGEEQVAAEVVAPDQLKRLAPLETVHICVKPADLDAALDATLPHTDPHTVFVSHLGGLTPFALAARLGSTRMIVAVPNTESLLRADGVVETDFHNFIWIGELDGTFTDRLDALQGSLSWVAPCFVTKVITGMVWSKAIYSLEVGLSGLVDAPPAEVFADRTVRRLAAALVREGIALAEAAGVEPIAFDFFDPNLYKAKGDGEGNVMDIWIKNAWIRREGFRVGFDYQFPAKAGLSWSLSPRNADQETTHLLAELKAEARTRGVAMPFTDRFAALFADVAGGRRAPSAECFRDLERARQDLGIRVPGAP